MTSYRDALRALGSILDVEHARVVALRPFPGASGSASPLPAHLSVLEDKQQGFVAVRLGGFEMELSARRVEELVLESRALRGAAAAVQTGSPVADMLRSVGAALDELHAGCIAVNLRPDGLEVTYSVDAGCADQHRLAYAREELPVLCQTTAAQRRGEALRRILILHQDPRDADPLRASLLAEFAVETVPTHFAKAVAQGNEAPDLAVVYVSATQDPEQVLDALRTLGGGSSPTGAAMPIVVVTAPGAALDTPKAFAAGAHDVLHEPVAPAILRARLRTWMLRGLPRPNHQPVATSTLLGSAA
ncbi:MAG: response regulator transcription factor [Chloroflexi bacterium]|nr:response regulator transcription factor [Chloroflexota bacterium]